LAERAVDTLLWLRAVAGDHVSEEGVFLRNERLIETGRGASRRLDIERLPKRETCSFGHLLQRGLTPELHREHALRPVELLPRSTMCTGIRIVLALSASPRATDWLIHQVA
jgi:hypothetical protein